jgi:hypothetical protein
MKYQLEVEVLGVEGDEGLGCPGLESKTGKMEEDSCSTILRQEFVVPE